MAQQLPFVPLAELRPEDYAFIDKAARVNAASDPTVKEFCMREVWEVIRRAKTRRVELEGEWLAIQRMITLTHDEGKKYNGRSNAYLPLYARIRKTLVSAITKGLFPSDEYMDVTDRERGDTEGAKACKEVIRYEFDCAAQLRANIKPFVGQYVDFGISCLKDWYRSDKATQSRRAARRMGQPQPGYSPDEGFTVSTRNMFNVVVYPEWAESERDLRLIAERMELPISYCRAQILSKRWENVEEALQSGGGQGVDQFDWHNQQSLRDLAMLPGTQELRNVSGSPVQAVIAVEAWCDVPLPRPFYGPNEEPSLPLPCRVLFINGVPVSVTRNPFHHQRHPYKFARDNVVAGSFYPNGAGRLVRNLQYLANDFANQTNDVGIFGLNPIWLVNTAYMAGPIGPIRPGGVIKTRDNKEAITPVSPKVEIVQHGMPLLAMIIGMTNDGGGAPPVSQGTKAASTATSTQILTQNASGPVQDSIEDIEAQVMVPLMKDAWALAVQYRDKVFIRTLMGDDVPTEFIISQIDVDPEFRFLSSSQASSRQARTSQILAFTDLLQKLGPALQMQGMAPDAAAIMQRFWNDGMGFRGFKGIVKPLAQLMQQAQANGAPPMLPPGQPGQPQPGGPPGGPQPPPARDGGSAVPQGNVGGSAEPVPGEGEQIQDAYGSGDAFASLAGLTGGVH